MRNKLFLLSASLSILTCLIFAVKFKRNNEVISYQLDINSVPVVEMPIVEDDPFAALAYGNAPIEQRGPEFVAWLSVSVQIRVTGASGSGTIVWYDPKTRWAWIQSCGHLWNGNMTAEQGGRKKVTCKIITWYHNRTKLKEPKEYSAEVLYYSNDRGRDVSLLRFQPDWTPNYFPIAPEGFTFQEGMRLHSCGCDSASEVAHYEVRYIGQRDVGGGWMDIVTTENSPRPGRSGGGLMNNNYFVGVCWGTTDRDGSGNGFFTSLSAVREYNKKNGFGFLNNVSHSWARMIPIRDRNNPQGNYPQDYIPIPQNVE